MKTTMTVPTMWDKAKVEVEAMRLAKEFNVERQQYRQKYPHLSPEEIEESIKFNKKHNGCVGQRLTI